MKRFKGGRPSPAMIVAGAALVIAMVGTAVAAPIAIKAALSGSEKKQVKKIAKNQVNKLAGGLSVANSDKLDNLDSKQLTPSAGINRTDNVGLTDSYAAIDTVTITVAGPSRLIANAAVHLDSDGGNNDRGDCRFAFNGAGGIGYSTDIVVNDETMPVVGQTTVGAGTHTVALQCLKNNLGSITVTNSTVTVSGHLL